MESRCMYCACVCMYGSLERKVGFDLWWTLWMVGCKKNSWVDGLVPQCDNKLPMFCYAGFVVFKISHQQTGLGIPNKTTSCT